MADFTATRPGQVNAAGAADALLYKVFSGEVLAAFSQANVMLDRHTVRTIQNGKSAGFTVMGRTTAAYHTAGTQVVGTNGMKFNEKVIAIDGLLLASGFIANIDEAMNAFDVRGPLAKELGVALGTAFDKAVIQEGIKGARAAALITGEPAGVQIKSDLMRICAGGATTVAIKAQAIAEALFQAATELGENNVTEQAYCVLRPSDYYALVQNLNVINNLYGGLGSIAEGNVMKVAGIEIVMSNNVPSTNLVADTLHGADFTKTIGLVWTKSSIATLKLLDMRVDVGAFDNMFQGSLITATHSMGHGWLRPEACIELALNTVTNVTV